jgi:hypothetical protein
LSLNEVEFRVIRGLGLPGKLLVRAANGDVETVEASLRGNPDVASFQRDALVAGQVLPNDSSFTELWGLDNTGQNGGTADADIDAASLDRVFHVLAGVTVYVSGVTITNGSTDFGGGIFNSGTLTMTD